MTNNFESFELPAFLRESLKNMNIDMPTPIQAASIPIGLEGHDILASAETGSGKTIAYSLPIISHLAVNPQSTALILAPTRLLVLQVQNNLKKLLGSNSSFNMALLIGGKEMRKQYEQLKKKPKIIIGTPGRICDHLNRGSLKLNNTGFLVLDEADRMLDMGFSEQLEYILKFLSPTRQSFMFSATLPINIIKLSEKYLNNPKRIQIGEVNKPAPKIQQRTVQVRASDKFKTLVQELESKKPKSSAIIFVKTKITAEELAIQLQNQQFNSEAIHGNLSQNNREKVLRDFRDQKIEIIVATDIAARGLDIPHIEYVFNYNLPESPEDYIHRIGRTGRAGLEGYAISFIAPEDFKKWNAIERLIQGKNTTFNLKRNHPTDSFSDKKAFKPREKNSIAKNRRDNFDNKVNYKKSNKIEFGNKQHFNKKIDSFFNEKDIEKPLKKLSFDRNKFDSPFKKLETGIQNKRLNYSGTKKTQVVKVKKENTVSSFNSRNALKKNYEPSTKRRNFFN